MLTGIKFFVTVCSHLVYSSTSKKEKKFFLFFTLTPSHMWLKRPVYRGFRGEGKCEGKCFTLTLPSHLTLPAGSTLLAGDSMNGRQIQWTGRKKAALYRQYSYGILLVQLCCTVGATMLSLLV